MNEQTKSKTNKIFPLLLAIGIVVSIATVVGFGWWAKATYFEAGAFVVTEGKDVDYSTRLKVRGTDLRVYEFTPQSAPHVSCIFIAGENKGDMECFSKDEVNNDNAR